MIAYPVSQESRWAVLQISTGEIVARNKPWPRLDGGPIEGLDPDYVYLLHINDTPPDYDSRLYLLESTETVDADANEIRRTHQTVKRAVAEQITAAENAEAEQLSRHIKLEREAMETRLMVGAILAYIVDAQQFPAKVRTMADTYKQKAVTLWKNRDRLTAIIAAINAGQEPDLDAGWEPPA